MAHVLIKNHVHLLLASGNFFSVLIKKLAELFILSLELICIFQSDALILYQGLVKSSRIYSFFAKYLSDVFHFIHLLITPINLISSRQHCNLYVM